MHTCGGRTKSEQWQHIVLVVRAYRRWNIDQSSWKMTFNNATSGEECHPRKLPKVQPGDEVVISGISGRFPESHNVKHLQENLLSKRDLITDDGRRWKLGMKRNSWSFNSN